VVFAMISYSKFDSKKNPILVISDRNNGVYLLNIVTLKKSQIMEIDSPGDIMEQSKKKIKLTKNWRGN
jgi:ABC-type enterochelin transport system ATPase subunit